MLLFKQKRVIKMDEERKAVESSVSIWHRDLNLVFVYVVIFLAGIVIVTIMINVLNSKVSDLNNGMYTPQGYNSNL